MLHSHVVTHVGSMVEGLKHCAYDQHGLGSKPTCTILLCPWEKNFITLSLAWWSCHAILIISLLSYKQTAISWHLWKQVRVIAYPMH